MRADPAEDGQRTLAGLDPYRTQREFSRQVGVLFAKNTLYRCMSVLGNLQFYCHLHHLPKTRPLEVVEQVGLADQTRTTVEKLSPGLSRRLALGRMLLTNPKVLLLADPFAGCEQVSMELISHAIRRQVEAGAAGLVFTQKANGLEKLCDTVHRLDRGRIVESYNPGEATQRNRPFMIPARAEDKFILIDPAEILYAFGQEDHTYLQTRDDRLPTQFTLTELEKRLSRSGFFRAHRALRSPLHKYILTTKYTKNTKAFYFFVPFVPLWLNV